MCPTIPKNTYNLFDELNSFINKETNQNIESFKVKGQNDYLADWYNTKQWRDLRAYKRREQPLCEDCLKNEKVTPVAEIHHVRPFNRGHNIQTQWQLFTDLNNLVSLCTKCHKERHKHL